MCTDKIYHFHTCQHTYKEYQPCGYPTADEDYSCLTACCGGRTCEGTQSRNFYSQAPCKMCAISRDSYVDPFLAQALTGLSGSDFNSYNPYRHPQHQRRKANNSWPAPRRAAQSQTAQAGNARPVRDLPGMPFEQQQAQYKSPAAMRADPRRAAPPQQIRVQQLTHARKPQIHNVAHPHTAQTAQVVYAAPKNSRRDSNGVSEFGSDDGDSPGWSGHGALPRAVSPLHQDRGGYQDWPVHG